MNTNGAEHMFTTEGKAEGKTEFQDRGRGCLMKPEGGKVAATERASHIAEGLTGSRLAPPNNSTISN